MRIEMLAERHPVRVTVVHPGGVRTNIATNALAQARALGLPVTPADERQVRLYNEKVLRMSPDRAAEIILRGVQRNRPRVLVGNDAKVIDLLVRILPATYPRGMAAAMRRFMRAHTN
jgi:short-subunit dehydrogenase